MKWFYNLKIGTKLVIGFIIMALITGVVGIFAIINLKSLSKMDSLLYQENVVGIVAIENIEQSFLQIRVNLRNLILFSDKDKSKYYDVIIKEEGNITKFIDTYNQIASNAENRRDLEDLKPMINEYILDCKKIVSASKEGKRNDEIIPIFISVADNATAADELINKMSRWNENQAKERSDGNTASASKTIYIMVVIIMVAMLVAIILGIFISKIISKPLVKAVNMIKEMGKGNLGIRLRMDTKDEVGQMTVCMDNLADIVNALVKDADMLSKAAVEGNLDIRADASKHEGDFKKIVDGVNNALDAVIGPLNVAAEYVDRISKGDIPSKITASYNGDFNEIKNNLNTCIDAVNALVADANVLSVAALEGKLSTRADASKHGGDFRKIVDGVNKTLDAVISPVKEAASVLKEMAKGNLQVSVNGNYMGDHAEIKDALNFTSSTISGYINEISEVLNKMAEGNLNVGINREYLGDFVEIKNSLNSIITAFNDVLGEINESSEQVALGSKQVSDSSQALSQGSTEQSSSVEEITASMSLIASQTKENATNANQANQLANKAKENAVEGNKKMADMINAMKEINQSSSNISKIIKVIDEIAFQTNILALNAAVEAARAGQHGKGFAVVAEEVRNLAGRSAKAAKETTDMIEGSIKKVEVGTSIANDTAVALDKIVEGIARSADLVADIARSSSDQALSITQINQAINQVANVIQTNSATSQEAAAASEELSVQAEVLRDAVMRFRLKNKTYLDTRANRLDSKIMKIVESTHATHSVSGAKKVRSSIELDNTDYGKY